MFITHLHFDSALVFRRNKSENKWYQQIPEEICYILGTKGESLSHLEVQKKHFSRQLLGVWAIVSIQNHNKQGVYDFSGI